MKKDQEILRLVEISRLYYEKELTQAQIGKQLNISRPAVSKLLSDARTRGIVKIEIRSPLDNDENLLDDLKIQFGLRGGLIVPSASKDPNLVRRLIVTQAAAYLDKLMPSVKNLGIGWGKTIGEMIEEYMPQFRTEITAQNICPVIGNAPNAIKWLQTNELTRELSEKTGFDPVFLNAPAFPSSLQDKQLFMNTVEYQNVSALWSQLDTVILGVGTYPTIPDQATAVRFGDKLKTEKAVGVIATYFFNRSGTIIESPDDVVIRIPLENLKVAKKVIVITGNPQKAAALHGALLTGLVTHLITDETTAVELLRIHSELP
ncbi:MAG: transcriptional regulator [Bacteroidetes bacterium]|nr:transcriptional regulator [Bacteroidota bacterium]